MNGEEYTFPEEDFLTTCTVSSFRNGKMYVHTDGALVGVIIPSTESWEKRFKKGETLEVYYAADGFTYYRHYREENNEET